MVACFWYYYQNCKRKVVVIMADYPPKVKDEVKTLIDEKTKRMTRDEYLKPKTKMLQFMNG